MTAFQFLITILVVVCSILVALFAYCKWCFRYWRNRNLPFLRPQLPFGYATEAICGKENISVTIRKIYEKMKQRGWKHGGIYLLTSPRYVAINLDYIRNIMVKDFEHFTDHNMYCNENDPMNNHLLNLCGQKWHSLRTKLNPIFTPSKMKIMFETVANCQENLLKKTERECAKNEAIDIREILDCFTIDVIGSCAFGLNLKSFEQENSQFKTFVKRIRSTTTLEALKRTFAITCPKLARYFNIFLIPEDISQYALHVIKDTIEHREKNSFIRNDLMQQLIHLKNNEAHNEPLIIKDIAAQCGLFFMAGFESSSLLMCFTLYELAKNQNIQDKVRAEINEVLAKHDGKVAYESIQEMKYLNQVLDEILRMYPPVPRINRKCVKEYKIPDEDVVIEKGTEVIIPLLGIHYDEEYYPDPEKFDPERFSEENKNLRHKYAHLPFGRGPRNCIGMRFAAMQAKVGLICLIKVYNFFVSDKTQEPLVMQANTLLGLWPVGKIWLNARKI